MSGKQQTPYCTQNKAVFIDRDGTVVKDVPYCSKPDDFKLFPGVAEGIKLLNKAGFKVVIITNQSGIGRGYFTEATLSDIHNKMIKELGKQDAYIDAIYYCPHHPDDNCSCRKPKPEMIYRAARDLDINISESYVVGDDSKDMELAKKAGCKAGIQIIEINQGKTPYFATSFHDAVVLIINKSKAELNIHDIN